MSKTSALNCGIIITGTLTCGSIYTDKIMGISSSCDDGYNLDPIVPAETIRQTNCKNCGAVLHNNHCEYCGSEY